MSATSSSWCRNKHRFSASAHIHSSLEHSMYMFRFGLFGAGEKCRKLRWSESFQEQFREFIWVFADVCVVCYPLASFVLVFLFSSWSRLVSPSMRSWRWWLTRRHGTDWERHMTAQKQSTFWSGSPTGLSEKPPCCSSSASVKSCCLGASSLTRKAL